MEIIMWVIIGLVVLLVLYLIAIMPRMWNRPDYSPYTKVLYAHRGLHTNTKNNPENSLEAFRLAVNKGYGIELDIQLSKDRVPVVFHDYTLKRMCGIDKRVDELDLVELKKLKLLASNQGIPTLEEVLIEVNGKVPLLIEYKVRGTNMELCEKSMSILLQYKGVYCVESFNPFVVRWFKQHHKTIVRGQLSTNFMIEKEKGNQVLYFVLSRLLLNFMTKPDFIAYQYNYPNMLSLLICKYIFKLPIAAWTIKNQADYEVSKKRFDVIIFDSFIPEK